MGDRWGGQSALNMLRRMFAVLPLWGIIALCSASAVRRNVDLGVASTIDCGKDGNSTACASRVQEVESGSNRTVFRVSRGLDGGSLGYGDGGVEEVSSRKKKNRGNWKLLVYFLGAGKLTMLYILIHAVAAVAGKALVVGKVALAIATAVLLKKSLEHKEKILYEIVKHPHYSYEHTHSSSVDLDHNGGFGEHDFGHRKRRRTYIK
ncbi:uncharacterized protein LOC128874823 [Hylaeus volcanicus]|uniref:uncharacterized protein LOC128874823 n=1 Tax=Hylaeus volcanicus TaxID=313075 RepID=UPI0023B7B0E1|nr:uncharacterized protein LOC128874823 [Hylaeus volcanicus]